MQFNLYRLNLKFKMGGMVILQEMGEWAIWWYFKASYDLKNTV